MIAKFKIAMYAGAALFVALICIYAYIVTLKNDKLIAEKQGLEIDLQHAQQVNEYNSNVMRRLEAEQFDDRKRVFSLTAKLRQLELNNISLSKELDDALQDEAHINVINMQHSDSVGRVLRARNTSSN